MLVTKVVERLCAALWAAVPSEDVLTTSIHYCISLFNLVVKLATLVPHSGLDALVRNFLSRMAILELAWVARESNPTDTG